MDAVCLEYIALAARDPAALAGLLSGPLELPLGELGDGAERVPLVQAGAVGLALFEVGDPRLDDAATSGLDHLGMAADDPEGLARGAGLEMSGRLRPGIGGDQLRVASGGLGGVRLRLGQGLGRSAAPAGVIERIDHVGVASADNRAAEATFAGRLGFEVESRQTDMEVRTVVESFTSDRYGVVYHARSPEPVGGLRVTFITVGDCELEFLEEFDAEGMRDSRAVRLGRGPGTTRQDQGAIGRYIARRGAGLHHLALKTADIDGVLSSLDRAGVETIDKVGRPGSRRARIGFIHPSASGGVLIHLVQRSQSREA